MVFKLYMMESKDDGANVQMSSVVRAFQNICTTFGTAKRDKACILLYICTKSLIISKLIIRNSSWNCYILVTVTIFK